jgi:hypothetical protein
MKDLGENINWGVTIKTCIFFPEKCAYLLFTSNGAVLKKLGKRFGMHSHLGPPQHQPAPPFGHVVVTPATSNTVCDGFHQGFRGFCRVYQGSVTLSCLKFSPRSLIQEENNQNFLQNPKFGTSHGHVV